MIYKTFRWRFVAVSVLMVVFVVSVHGEESSDNGPPGVPKRRLNYVYPPLPPGMQESQELIERVLKLFPDALPGATMAVVHKEFPREMQRFRAVASGNPAKATELLTRIVGESVKLMDVKDRDPALYQRMREQRRLDRRVDSLARVIWKSTGEKQKKSRTEMRETLEESFEIKQNLMREEVRQIENDLDELRDLINRREAKRDEIVKRRMSEVLEKSDDLGW